MNNPNLDPKREKDCTSEITFTSAPLPAPLEPDTPTSASEHEVFAKLETHEGTLTDVELDKLESRLRLRAAVLGWTGHPLHQPATVVLKVVAAILRERIAKQTMKTDSSTAPGDV